MDHINLGNRYRQFFHANFGYDFKLTVLILYII